MYNKLFNTTGAKVFSWAIGLLVCFIMLSAPANGQEYKLLYEGRDLTFAIQDAAEIDSLYYFVQIDSIQTSGEDTLYYFNHQLQPGIDGDCPLIYNDTVFLGRKAIKRNDEFGTYVFFNGAGDSIFIRTKIKTGDFWKLFIYPDASYIKATVINHLDGGIINGLMDSIFRIKLNAYTNAGISMPDVFPSETKFDISKHYGMQEFFDMRVFPAPGDGKQRKMRGITAPDTGIVDITARNAFSFETGYEFHYKEITCPDVLNGANKHISSYKYFVLAANADESGATYDFVRVQIDSFIYDASTEVQTIWDTITRSYTFSDYVFLDTAELNIFEWLEQGYSDWEVNDTVYAGVPHKFVYDLYQYDEDTKCLTNPENNTMPLQLYGQGLGPIYYVDSTSTNDFYSLRMVYFKLGLQEWGSPYDFSYLDNPVTNLYQDNNFVVYPNPAQAFVTLSLPEILLSNSTYTIYTISGVVAQEGITDTNISMPLLPNGLYFIEIHTENGTWKSRFIKQQ